MGPIPSQYHLFLGIAGLLILFVIVASAAQKYQAWQVQKEMVLRRMLNAVRQLEDIFEMLQGAALPKQLVILLRKEVLARYVAMRQIHKGIKGIAEDIEMAQRKLQSSESMGEAGRQVASDRNVLNRYVSGLTSLIEFMQTSGRIAGMNGEDKKRFVNDLADLRAGYLNDFHSREAQGLAEQEMWSDASAHLKELLHFLSSHGPATAYVTEIYKKANAHYKQVVMRQVPGAVSLTADEVAENTRKAAAGMVQE